MAKPFDVAVKFSLWLVVKAVRLALSQASPPVRAALDDGAEAAEHHWLPGFKARTAATPSRVDDYLARGAARLLRVLQGAR